MTFTDHDRSPVERPSRRTDRRRRVVDAFVDLVLEGDGHPPTPEDVAKRAGVSRATFFRYFATLHELRSEAAGRTIERYSELLIIPETAAGSLPERVAAFVDARVRFHETVSPLALLLRASAALDSESGELLDANRRVLSDQVKQHFHIELAALTPARRDDLVVSIAVMTSVESWHQFRQASDRSPAQTRRAWRAAVAAMLAAASVSDEVGLPR